MKKVNFSWREIGIRIACMILLCPSLHKLTAQQTPLFSTYHFNRFLVNPAFTGIDNEYRAFGFYRTQWVSMPGQPVTGGATAEGSFWKDRIGAGLYIVNDKIGVFNRTNISLSYAQKITFAKNHQIAIGVQGGTYLNRINFGMINAKDYDDPSIAQSKPLKAVFDLSVGISYKWKDLLVGFSVPHVTQPKNKYGTTTGKTADYQYVRHYNAFAQYRISLLKGNFNITPTIMMRKGPASAFQFDATALFDYKNIAFVGAGYRNSFGAVAIAGVNILDMFTIAYACDFTTQKTLKGQVGTTHEVTAGFHLPSDYKIKRKKDDLTDMAAIQAMDDLSRRNDTLSAKLKLAQQKLGKANQEAADAKREKEEMQHRLDSVTSAAAKVFSTNNTPGVNQNSVYSLDRIYFEMNEYMLLPESKGQLDSLVNLMKTYPDMEIAISGHTDNTGNEQKNEGLSRQRAKAVADYLIANGITSGRLTYTGYGSKKPLTDNSSESARKQNRRVEFSIIR